MEEQQQYYYEEDPMTVLQFEKKLADLAGNAVSMIQQGGHTREEIINTVSEEQDVYPRDVKLALRMLDLMTDDDGFLRLR